MAHEIRLPTGDVAVVDDDDAAVCGGFRWRVHPRYSDGVRVGVAAVVSGRGGSLRLLHRFLLRPDAGDIIDHIDGNPLNNRRSNLRICSHAENMRNSAMRRNNKSGVKGVYLETRPGLKPRWRASVRLDGKTIHLGSYNTKDEAAGAYAAGSIKHHGEFARPA